jgi:hypothetical protein
MTSAGVAAWVASRRGMKMNVIAELVFLLAILPAGEVFTGGSL